jgi:AraC-like DNA-binding protein
MDYNEFVCDLPVNDRFSFSSVEENEEVMKSQGINQHLRQLGKGSFRADFAMLESTTALLTADRFNKACSVYLEPPPDTVALMVFRTTGEQFLASGENVANDKLIVLPDGNGVDLVIPDLAGSETLVIPKSRYAELTQAISPSYAQPDGVAILKGDTPQLHGIRDAVTKAIVDKQANDNEIANIVAHMISWAGYSAGDVKHEKFYSQQTKARIAKQVQSYIEEHYHEGILIEELCLVTGKEVRTLQRCFRQYFDNTITGYLKIVRLNAAHRALSSAHPDEETVTSIALQSGFTHFGRFSTDYRKHFGVSARETLVTRQS